MVVGAGDASWRSMPVFVSSTFRDLDGERDVLQRLVWPELNDRLRDRGCEVVGIDLRWGVDTSSEEGQAAKEAAVLTVCLREIERTRPLFLVLLGDRYGWVPPAERLVTAGVEGGSVEPGASSVTHLEIDRALAADPDVAAMAVALVRDPLPYAEMEAADAARFSDAHATDELAPERAERLVALKHHLEGLLGDRYVRYPAGWDGEHVTGLDGAFARLAVAALWAVLDAATADRVDAVPPGWQERERRALAAHLAIRGRDVVGREDEVGRLVAFARGQDERRRSPRGLLVVAPPGTGKSSVLARAHAALAGDGVVLVHAGGLTPRSRSVREVLVRWSDELGALTGAPEVDERASVDQLTQELGERLAVVAAQRRVVLVVDALDQLGPSVVARRLTWLPDPLPDGVRILASCTPGADADALSGQVGWRRLDLRPLDDEAARALVATVARRRGRQVPRALLDVIAGERDGADRDDRRNPLWLHLVTAELLELGSEHYEALDAFDGTAEQRLQRLLEETARGFPQDLPGLYRALYERAGSVHGPAFVATVLGLLATSRRGLRESDLAALLGTERGGAWNPLAFARLRRQLRAHLVEEDDGRWDFTHHQGREAARPATAAQAIPWNRRLADHLAGRAATDPLRVDELAHHLLTAGDLDAVVVLLAGDLSDAAGRALVDSLVEALSAQVARDGAEAAAAWGRALVERPVLDRGERRTVLERWVGAVDPALDGAVPVAARRDVLGAVAHVSVTPDAIEVEPESFAVVVALHLRLGDLWAATGHGDLAGVAYGEALAFAERARTGAIVEWEDWDCPSCGAPLVPAGRPDPSTVVSAAGHLRTHGMGGAADWIEAYARFGFHPDAHRDLASVHDRLGDLALAGDDLEAARRHHGAAAAARRGLYGLYEGAWRQADEVGAEVSGDDAELLEAGRVFSASLRSLAVVEYLAGRHDEARALTAEALAVTETLAARVPADLETGRELAAVHTEAARLATAEGDLVGAGRHLGEAVAALRRVHRAAPDEPAVALALVDALVRSGGNARDRGGRADLEDAIDEAVALVHTALAAPSVDPGVVPRVVNALCLGAELAESRGDPAGAESLLEESELRALALGEDTPVGWSTTATVRVQLGDLRYREGRFSEARDAYRSAVPLLDERLGSLPEDDDRARDAAVALLRAVAVSTALGDAEAMVADLGRAEPLLDRLLERRPGDQAAALARAEAWTARARLAADHGDDAGAALDSALGLLDALRMLRVGDPVVAEQWAAALVERAGHRLASGRPDEALADLRAAHTVRLDRHAAAPDAPGLVVNLAQSHARLAAVLTEVGDRDGAVLDEIRTHEDAALGLLSALTAVGSDGPWPWMSLAGVEHAVGVNAVAREEPAAAVEHFTAALAAVRRAVAAGTSDPDAPALDASAREWLSALGAAPGDG